MGNEMNEKSNNGNSSNVRIVIVTVLALVLVVVCFTTLIKPRKDETSPAATMQMRAGDATTEAKGDSLQLPDTPEVLDRPADFMQEPDVPDAPEPTEFPEIGAGAGKIDPPPMSPRPDGPTLQVQIDEGAKPDPDPEVPEEKGPYDIYLVDEDWIKQYGGFCVERNGKLYALCDEMPTTVCTVFNCGYQIGDGGFKPDGCSYLNLYDQREISDVPTQAKDALISVGDFPIFYIEPGEELRFYSSQPVENVPMKRAEFYGYTIPATGRQVAYFPIIDFAYGPLNGNITNPAVLTPEGNPVEDVRRLEYGKEYMFEWYEGTEYRSQTFLADCRCYRVDDDELTFKIPVKMTKNGYGVVDLSEVEAGGNTYTIQGLPFELK